MSSLLKPGLMFAAGIACTLGLVALLGAAEQPAAKTRQLDTEIVPVAGGLALILSVNDREKNRLYIYEIPTKKDRQVRIRGSIDLSAVGEEQLPADLNMD